MINGDEYECPAKSEQNEQNLAGPVQKVGPSDQWHPLLRVFWEGPWKPLRKPHAKNANQRTKLCATLNFGLMGMMDVDDIVVINRASSPMVSRTF